MGTVSIEVPGPGTYQVQCDPNLPALADGGTAGDVLAGKQFYNDRNVPVTGTMPNNPPQAVELSGGNSYTIPRGFHDGTGKVTGVGTVLPDITSPAGAGDILAGKQAVSGDGTRITGTMPSNPPEDVEVSGGERYQIPEGYHTGAGKVTGKGTVLPALTDAAGAADILIGKEAIDQSGQELTGTMPDNGAVSAQLAAGGSYTIPAGYHNGQGKVTSTAAPLPSLSDPAGPGDILSSKEAIDGTGAKVTGTMPTATQATPSISVSSSGLITATAQQSAGYVAAGTKTATQQLETQGAQTIVPGTADQTVPAGKFLTGAQTVQGDADLLPGNIKTGVNIFGVSGALTPTYVGRLVVTVDSGAVVTATDGTTTLTETSTGTATFYLPNGGTWTVSATLNSNRAPPVEVATQENFPLTVSPGGSQQVTVPNQYEVELEFIPIYTVTLTIDPAGSGSATGAGSYERGTQVTVTATAGEDYDFSQWTESGTTVSTNSQYTFSITKNRVLVAAFTEKPKGPPYYAHVTSPLSQARRELAATTIGNYALFAGGWYGANTNSSVVDAYDSSLVKTTPTSLSAGRYNLAATSVKSYALFAGGARGNVSTSRSAVVDAYNTSLTRTTPTALSQARSWLAAANAENYALFGGGNSGSSNSAVVDAYNTSLTRTTPTALRQARSWLAAGSVAYYALFAGGVGSSVVDAYSTSLTRTTPTALSQARDGLAGTALENYALFGGGYGSSVVDAYNTSLTRTTPTALSQARRWLAAANAENYALFGGGNSGSSNSAVVDAYNTSLTRTTPKSLSVARSQLAAARAGGYAIFAGGYSADGISAVVDAYTE